MSNPNPRDTPVDVIVPVYRGLAETRRCLESVLANPQVTAMEVVVVDDAGPEPALSAWLDGLRDAGHITLLRNEANLGFVRSVNRGMALHPDRDVVLLNSDTEVANDWLDRLRAAAWRGLDVGTVTPFSNNATICSYPVFCADNPLPVHIGFAELDRAFRRVNAGESVDIPTAVGFCMYIRRDCLEAVGPFDAERFGRGYGEENDFCRRAAAAGWRNVLAADTFVFHAGATSFGTDRHPLQRQAGATLLTLHPDYDEIVRRFIRADPAAPLRRAVALEVEQERRERAAVQLYVAHTPGQRGQGRAHGEGRPVQLHVAHTLGGGIAHWLMDYCLADPARTNLVLKPFCRSQDFGEGLALYADIQDQQPARLWLFDEPIHATVVSHAEYRQAIHEIIDEYGIDAILVSSLIGHALDILDTGLPTVHVCHDYYPYCPAINIHFHGRCDHCDAARVAECHAHNPDYNPFQDFPPEERLAVRARFVDLAAGGGISLAAPSQSVFDNLARLEPRFLMAGSVVIPHGRQICFAPLEEASASGGGRLRILILGMLANSKGVALLNEALDEITRFADIYLLGTGELEVLFHHRPGVHVLGGYRLAELPGIVADIAPDVGLLMSVCEETFSYTLGELMMLGVPPVATRVGSFPERIRDGETGFLFEPDTASMLARLRGIDADRPVLAGIRRNLREVRHRSAEEMVADYHRLLPVRRHRAPRAAMPGAAAIHDPVLIGLAEDLAGKWREVKSLRLTLGLKDGLVNRLGARCQGLEEALRDQDRRIEALWANEAANAERLRGLEAEVRERDERIHDLTGRIEGLLASTSWRFSRPVRLVGRRVRQTRILARCLIAILRRPGAPAEALASLRHAWRVAGIAGVKHELLRLAEPEPASVAIEIESSPPPPPPDWRQESFRRYRDEFESVHRGEILARIADMAGKPLISVLVPTFDTDERMLRDMLDSVRGQLYPNWELCVSDDGSTLPQVRQVLEEYAGLDGRIRLRFGEANRGVSHASNQALSMAGGEFVVLLDHDDRLEPQALFRVAEAVLAEAPDMLYSDEVIVAGDGATVEHFIYRPVFSPEYLRSHPYIVHLVGFRPGLLREIGGFDETLRISQDYDLILRASERAERITHIPEMLYRWRTHPRSAGHRLIDRVMETSKAILQRHLHRCGEEGVVIDGPSFNFFEARYPLADGLKVAIIIPTKNHGELVRVCLESIERTAGAVDHDIVLIDHESDDPASLAYFDGLGGRVRRLRYHGPFNFSAMNNWAVAQLGSGYSHYLFCNNDVEAIEPGWLERMLELGQRPGIGVVGAKLYYPDHKTLQHAGVVVACCGVAENLGRFRITNDDPLDLGYIGSLIVNREVSAVTAACMLMKVSVFEAIGGFDEAMAVGYSDVDLCLKAWQAGQRVVFCAHAALLHHESYTRGRHPEDPHPEDSRLFVAKWRDMFATGDPYFNPNFAQGSPDWQVAQPLPFRLDIQRRVYRASSA